MEPSERYWEQMRGFAYKLANGYNLPPHTSAEDIAQDAMVALLKALPGFREHRGDMIAFSRVVVRNATLNAIKQAFEKFGNGFHKLEDCGPDQYIADDTAEKMENMKLVNQLLSHLPPNKRVVVEMSYLKGMTNKEIAECLGITPPAVGLILRGALEALRGLVKK